MIVTATSRYPESLVDRLQEIIDLHFDPHHGSPFWLERAAALSLDPRRRIRAVEELRLLGDMSPEDLRGKPLRYFVPRALHRQWHQMIVGQTGGTTGEGAWTAYLEEEFEEAFIQPFAAAAKHVGFPWGGDWLYVGPSGPHVIGKVVRALARERGSADPFSVDFDPRWAKKLPPNSLALSRYLDHIIEQAMALVERQEIAVIFTTPAVLGRLAERMNEHQRFAIRGVHYGGMALALNDLERFQATLFPNAVHVSGYGNTLFGCCLELDASPGRSLDYFPFGERLIFHKATEAEGSRAFGEPRQVCFTRLDRSMLIVRMRERDTAEIIPPPGDAPAGFRLPGVRNPQSPLSLAPAQRPGLY